MNIQSMRKALRPSSISRAALLLFKVHRELAISLLLFLFTHPAPYRRFYGNQISLHTQPVLEGPSC